MVRRQIRKPLVVVRALIFSLLPIPLLPWCQNMRAVNDSINPGLVKPEPLPEVPYREGKGGWRDIDVCGRGDHFIAHRSPDLPILKSRATHSLLPVMVNALSILTIVKLALFLVLC